MNSFPVKFGVVFILVSNVLVSFSLILRFDEIALGNSVNVVLALGQICTGFASGVILYGLWKAGEIG